MRVGIIAPPWIPVPPRGYGGIEQVVDLQARGLADAGHDVVLVAAPGSHVPGVRVHSPLTRVPDQIGAPHVERTHVVAAHRILDGVDVVIDHSSAEGLELVAPSVPSLHVIHGTISARAHAAYRRVARAVLPPGLVAISEAQRRSAPGLAFTGVCHNGIDVAAARYSDRHEGYLAFLGRMSPDKGAREAIEIAAAIGLPLKIAAKCREPQEQHYFDSEIRPRLGREVEWLGELEGAEKYALLAGAAALVFPIAWEEPFGLVMVEAMACGTPVIATRRGAVPEVVADGVTGLVRNTPEHLARVSLGAIEDLDRSACRDRAVRHFSHHAMARRLEQLAAGAVARSRPRRQPERVVRSLSRGGRARLASPRQSHAA